MGPSAQPESASFKLARRSSLRSSISCAQTPDAQMISIVEPRPDVGAACAAIVGPTTSSQQP